MKKNAEYEIEDTLHVFQKEIRVFHYPLSQSTLLGHSEQIILTFYDPEL